MWLGKPATSDHGSSIKTEARYRDWDKFVPFSLKTTKRHTRSRRPFVEHSTITTKRCTRRRAYSVAFACNVDRNPTTKNILPQPSPSTVNERKKSTKVHGNTVVPVSKG